MFECIIIRAQNRVTQVQGYSYYLPIILVILGPETSSISTHCLFHKIIATRLYFKLLVEILYQYDRLGSLYSNICNSKIEFNLCTLTLIWLEGSSA